MNQIQSPDDLDLWSPEEIADHGVSALRLRECDPVHLSSKGDTDFYIMSRYKDISQALHMQDVFIAGRGNALHDVEPAGLISDPPMHTFFRSLVQPDFKPSEILKLKTRLGEIVNELLDDVQDEDEWELHDRFSLPYPVIVICEILGIPPEDIPQFKYWSDMCILMQSTDDPTPYLPEMHNLFAYLVAHMDKKRDDLEDQSLLARIARAEWNGKPLTNDQAVELVAQLFVAGNETTTSLITNLLWRMLSHEGMWADYCAGKIDTRKAINESLRFDPPLLALGRTTSREVEFAGTTIPDGVKVLLHFGAANRDPSVIDNPDVFDPTRTPKRHLSFGHGLHICLGRELALLEAEVAMDILRERFPNLQLVNDGTRIEPQLFWGRRTLPLRNG